MEDLVTRLRFRAAVDLQTWKAYARVGFRTERLSPINIMEGFTLLKQLPLDGNKGNVKLEVKANFALPEPEIEYSTESHRSLVGMGKSSIVVRSRNAIHSLLLVLTDLFGSSSSFHRRYRSKHRRAKSSLGLLVPCSTSCTVRENHCLPPYNK